MAVGLPVGPGSRIFVEKPLTAAQQAVQEGIGHELGHKISEAEFRSFLQEAHINDSEFEAHVAHPAMFADHAGEAADPVAIFTAEFQKYRKEGFLSLVQRHTPTKLTSRQREIEGFIADELYKKPAERTNGLEASILEHAIRAVAFDEHIAIQNCTQAILLENEQLKPLLDLFHGLGAISAFDREDTKREEMQKALFDIIISKVIGKDATTQPPDCYDLLVLLNTLLEFSSNNKAKPAEWLKEKVEQFVPNTGNPGKLTVDDGRRKITISFTENATYAKYLRCCDPLIAHPQIDAPVEGEEDATPAEPPVKRGIVDLPYVRACLIAQLTKSVETDFSPQAIEDRIAAANSEAGDPKYTLADGYQQAITFLRQEYESYNLIKNDSMTEEEAAYFKQAIPKQIATLILDASRRSTCQDAEVDPRQFSAAEFIGIIGLTTSLIGDDNELKDLLRDAIKLQSTDPETVEAEPGGSVAEPERLNELLPMLDMEDAEPPVEVAHVAAPASERPVDISAKWRGIVDKFKATVATEGVDQGALCREFAEKLNAELGAISEDIAIIMVDGLAAVPDEQIGVFNAVLSSEVKIALGKTNAFNESAFELRHEAISIGAAPLTDQYFITKKVSLFELGD